jgi:hypothetical protein
LLGLPSALALTQSVLEAPPATAPNLNELPANLPRPKDDGGARHLQGDGDAGPRAAVDGEPPRQPVEGRAPAHRRLRLSDDRGRPCKLPAGWDEIPGARGCTPETCGFRDHHKDLAKLEAEVFGSAPSPPRISRRW